MKYKYALMTILILILSGKSLAHGIENGKSNVEQEPNYEYFSLNYNIPEKLMFPLNAKESDRFYLVHQDMGQDKKSFVQEWIPKGQNLENWKEMISILFSKTFPKTTANLERNLKSVKRYPGSISTFKTIYKGRNNLLVLLELPNGHKNIAPFTSIVHYTLTPQGVHCVLYETRFHTLDAAIRKTWVERLGKAFICKDSENENFIRLQKCFERMLGNEISEWSDHIDYDPLENGQDREMAHMANSQDVLEKLKVSFYKLPPKTNPPSDLEFLGDAYRNAKINLSEDFDFHVLSNEKNDIIYEVNYKDIEDENTNYPYKFICRKFLKDNHVYRIIYMRYSKIQKMSDKDKNSWVERLNNAV